MKAYSIGGIGGRRCNMAVVGFGANVVFQKGVWRMSIID